MFHTKRTNTARINSIITREINQRNELSEEYKAFQRYIRQLDKYDNNIDKAFEELIRLKKIKNAMQHAINYATLNEHNIHEIITNFLKESKDYKEIINKISFNSIQLIYDYIKYLINFSFDFIRILEFEMKQNYYDYKNIYVSILQVNEYLKNFSENLLNIINKKINNDLIKKKQSNMNLDKMIEKNHLYTIVINKANYNLLTDLKYYLEINEELRDIELDSKYFHKVPIIISKRLQKFQEDVSYLTDNIDKLLNESLYIEDLIFEHSVSLTNRIDFENLDNKDLKKRFKLLSKKKKLNKLKVKDIRSYLIKVSKKESKKIKQKVKEKYKKVKKNIPDNYNLKLKNTKLYRLH